VRSRTEAKIVTNRSLLAVLKKAGLKTSVRARHNAFSFLRAAGFGNTARIKAAQLSTDI
jgi:hypothetical protein